MKRLWITILLLSGICSRPCPAQVNSVTFRPGDILSVKWRANPPADSVLWYNIYWSKNALAQALCFATDNKDSAVSWNQYQNDAKKDTTSNLSFDLPGNYPGEFTQNIYVYVSATNRLAKNDLQWVEGLISDTAVVFYYLEPGLSQTIYDAKTISDLNGFGGTLSKVAPNYYRLGLWDNFTFKLQANLIAAGTYKIQFYASAKSGAPTISIDGVSTEVVQIGSSGKPYSLTTHLDEGLSTLDFKVSGGDLWLWGNEAIVVTLLKKDVIYPGKVTGVAGGVK